MSDQRLVVRFPARRRTCARRLEGCLWEVLAARLSRRTDDVVANRGNEIENGSGQMADLRDQPLVSCRHTLIRPLAFVRGRVPLSLSLTLLAPPCELHHFRGLCQLSVSDSFSPTAHQKTTISRIDGTEHLTAIWSSCIPTHIYYSHYYSETSVRLITSSSTHLAAHHRLQFFCCRNLPLNTHHPPLRPFTYLIMSNKGRSTPRIVCCAIPIARAAGKVLLITSRKRPNSWVCECKLSYLPPTSLPISPPFFLAP